MDDFLDRISKLSPKRLALLAVELQSRLEALQHAGASDHQSAADPVAIVGIGCRFPGRANDPESFWQLLRSGVDAITEVPRVRWDMNALYDPDPAAPGKMTTRWGGFLDEVDQFDAPFFGITPREAMTMDPQQRLLLEVSWEALEHAGESPARAYGTDTGVFVGICTVDYYSLQHQRLGLEGIDLYQSTGSAHSVAAGRLSYFLGLHGPSVAVDTACSSSLVAIHLACQSLRSGECHMALAGGVNVIISPETTVALSKARAIAAGGRCKVFDAHADGFVRGEGCGMVVLKRLSDALTDGDRILALIRGSAMNQDGHSNGLTAPNGKAQEAVIRTALDKAGVEPGDIDYVETHGTGTVLGDPIEVRALGATLCSGRTRPLILGSVKSNIGHLEAAAGVASLIKTVLTLQHGEIPPHLHFEQPNPYIPWGDFPAITIPTANLPWPATDGRRLAGVSSFGFSGTNAHVILEEAPAPHGANDYSERPISQYVYTLSAKSEQALSELAARHGEHLAHSADQLPDVCFTANAGRAHFNHRLAIVAQSRAELGAKLAAGAKAVNTEGVVRGTASSGPAPEIVFLFTGQGSQYPNMGRQLYETQPVFRGAMERCDGLLRPYLHQSLLSVLYPSDTPVRALLDETSYTQPALFSLEYALAELWKSWGIIPAAVMGHSVGEYTAACVAGVLSLPDALKLVAERGRLMKFLPPGGEMATVFAPEATVSAAIAPYRDQVSIAAINWADCVVISGLGTVVRRITESLRLQGVKSRPLNVSVASHSPLVEPILDAFERTAATVKFLPPQIEVISGLTGQIAAADEIASTQYWRRHTRGAVRFYDAMRTLHHGGKRVLLELGPDTTLLSMARRCLADAEEQACVWLPSLRSGHKDWQEMLTSLATLYVHGAEVDWARFHSNTVTRPQRVSLPTYPFQRQRYWFEPGTSENRPWYRSASTVPDGQNAVQADWLYEVEWQPKAKASPGPDMSGLPAGGVVARPAFAEAEHADGKTIVPTASNERPINTLIFADHEGVGCRLAQLLAREGQACALIAPGRSYRKAEANCWEIDPASPEDYRRLLHDAFSGVDAPCRQENNNANRHIVHLWSLDATSQLEATVQSLTHDQTLGCASVLHLVQAILKECKPIQTENRQALPGLWLVTRNAQPVEDAQLTVPPALAQAPLWGLGRVIALEHPELWNGLVDLAQDAQVNDGPDKDAAYLLNEILYPDDEDQIAWRRGERWVTRLAHRHKPLCDRTSKTESWRASSDAAYLITGGLGGLGIKVARWMALNGARHLVLLGRSGARGTDDADVLRKATAIGEIEALGTAVTVVAADVADQTQMSDLFERFGRSLPSLRGIVHAAAGLSSWLLSEMPVSALQSASRAKVNGTWVLHELTKSTNLDFFVSFSSTSALWGSRELAHYAAANVFLDVFAHFRHALGLPALTINWGAWDEMRLITAEQREMVADYGLLPMAEARALAILGELLSNRDIAQIAVARVDWPRLKTAYEARRPRPFLDRMESFSEPAAQTPQGVIPPAPTDLLRQLEATTPAERRGLVAACVRQEVASILRLVAGQTVDDEQGLFEMGMDSLMSVELRGRLQTIVGRSLPSTLTFNYPSIVALVDYLTGEVLRIDCGETSKAMSGSGASRTSDNELSEDELEALLAMKLAGIHGNKEI